MEAHVELQRALQLDISRGLSSRSQMDQKDLDAPCYALLWADQLPRPSDPWLPPHPPSSPLMSLCSTPAVTHQTGRSVGGITGPLQGAGLQVI